MKRFAWIRLYDETYGNIVVDENETITPARARSFIEHECGEKLDEIDVRNIEIDYSGKFCSSLN